MPMHTQEFVVWLPHDERYSNEELRRILEDIADAHGFMMAPTIIKVMYSEPRRKGPAP